MATYAIGDIQGCRLTFERLLARVRFDPVADRLWLVGDLVNRGPDSAGVLRRVRGLGERAVTVLGNHDLHLLSVARGLRERKATDTFDDVLTAPDREQLLGWLRTRPILHREGSHILVHAGLAPGWTPDAAEAIAREVEAALAGPDIDPTLTGIRRGLPVRFDEDLRGTPRRAAALAHFAFLRTLHVDGRLCEQFKGPPEHAPDGCVPWFDLPGRLSRDATIVCGHWAALGLYLRPDLMALDSGCVWGRSLTAVRLEDRAVFQEPLEDDVSSLGD